MNILFFGTPEFVLPVLEKLHKEFNSNPKQRQLLGVVTQPPSNQGREKIITRSAVDNWAYKHKLPVFYDLEDLPAADLGILAAYGKIIPQEVISQFSLGILNIHPSLLPKFRGASPIQATIATGEQPGVSVIKMDDEMDHGPIVSQFKDYLEETDTNESLRTRLFERSAEFLINLIPNYLSGKIKQKPQDQELATYTKLIKKQDGFIPPVILNSVLNGEKTTEEWKVGFIKDYSTRPTPLVVDRFIKALTPWPGAWSNIQINDQELRIKILKAHVSKEEEQEKLILDLVQLEGKNEVTWKQFCDGYPKAQFT